MEELEMNPLRSRGDAKGVDGLAWGVSGGPRKLFNIWVLYPGI